MASLRGTLVVLSVLVAFVLRPVDTNTASWQISLSYFVNDLASALVKLMNKMVAMDDLRKAYGKEFVNATEDTNTTSSSKTTVSEASAEESENNSSAEAFERGLDQVKQQIYTDQTRAEMKPVSGEQIVKEMADRLSKFFTARMDALESLVDKAESLVAEYSYDPYLKEESVEFVDMKNPQASGLTLEYDPHFKVEVNFSESAVHIPLEIYEGYPHIQNDLRWTKNLNEAFRDNLEKYPDLRWQYFGSQTGLMRMFPATHREDPPHGIPDLYDVRRRPWYIQGSTSPKDMLIMMDTSGSVHGQTLEIMKMAVKTLLNTLGENDYVNVAWFSKELGWVSCLETFVQATVVNKLILFDGVNARDDKDMANYGQALEFAFDAFKKFDRDNKANSTEGANCHKVIMFFTDGSTDDPHDVYVQQNANKTVRIFSFAIGPHSVPIHTIKRMACDNKGYFTTIPAMAAMRTKIQEYVHVLSRPLALSGTKQTQWTNFYLDAMGMGMITTVSLPVFNRSQEARNQSIVGVMGIDIPVKELEALIQDRKLGPNGYVFAINNNGLMVFHPDMKTEGEYLDDPPDVDFLDLEGNQPELIEIRKKMIDEETGSKRNVDTVQIMPGQRYASRQKKNYFYQPIANTPFSLAVVLPSDKTLHLTISPPTTKPNGSRVQDIKENGTLVAPWEFCGGSVANNISDLLFRINNRSTECNDALVEHFIWDVEKTKSVPKTWETIIKEREKFPFSDNVEFHFIGTEGGLTRVYPTDATEFMHGSSDTWRAHYYRRALYNDKRWIFSAAVKKDLNATITAVKAINIRTRFTGVYYKPAVVGIRFTEKSLNDLMMEGQFSDFHLPGIETNPKWKRDMIPCGSDKACYLLDDGGYILTSNDEERLNQVNTFIGDVDPELMWSLFANGIYKWRETYNYQAICSKTRPAGGSASTFKNNIPLLNLMGSLNFHTLLDAAAWIYLKFNLWSWFQSLFAAPADAMLEFGSITRGTERCVMVRKHFYLGTNVSVINDFQCGNSSRKLSAMQLKDTNLVFVAIELPFGPDCEHVMQLTQEPEKVSHGELCQFHLRPSRYRKRVSPCFAADERENTSDCSGATTLEVTFVPLMLLTILSLVILKQQHQ